MDRGGSTSTAGEDVVADDSRLRSLAGALKLELFDIPDGPNADVDQQNGDPNVAEAPPLPNIPGLELLRRIGQGGMGIVYEAFDPSLKRRVAIKMLSGLKQSEESFLRMRTEAEAAARLSHPGIVQVYRFDEADSRPFIVMELVGGESLAQRLAGEPQPPRDAAALTMKLAEALHYAHQHQVIHRDLKPSNILFETTFEGAPLSELAPKIADFGLAKVLDADIETTRDGQLIGTPTYAAPEQLRPGLGAIGPAADVYSLGAVLHTMLTARPPLQSDDLWRTVQMVLETEPLSPRQLQPSVPIDLDTITLRCLMKEPGRRYRDAGELAADLRRFLTDEPIEARPIGRLERAWRWARRNPAVALTSSGLAILLVATMVTAIFAAIHFRGLERERNGQRIAAEKSLLDSRLALADSLRVVGLQMQADKHHHLAAVCFAEATNQLPAGDPRLVFDELRTATALRLCPRPKAWLDAPHDFPIEDVTYHPTGRWLIAYPKDRGAPPTLWDLENAEAIPLPSAAADVTALAWDRPGHKLVIGTEDGRVLIAGFPGLETVDQLRCDSPITIVGMSRDGSILAAATPTRMHLWRYERPSPAVDPTDDTATSLQPATEESESQAYTSLLSDGRWEEHWVRDVPNPPADLVFSPDDRHLVIVLTDRTMTVHHTDVASTSAPTLVTTCGRGAIGPTRLGPQFDHRGRLIVWSEEKLDWYDLDRNASVRTETTPPALFCETRIETGEVVVGCENHFIHCGPATRQDLGVETRASACWHPGGGVLTGSAEMDSLIRWSADFREGSGWPLFQPDGVIRMRLSPDGRLLTTIAASHQLRVWELPEPAYRPIEIKVNMGASRGRFDPSGQFLLVRAEASAEESVTAARVFRLDDGIAAGPPLNPEGQLVESAWLGTTQDVLTLAQSPTGCAIDVWDGLAGKRQRPTISLPIKPMWHDPSDRPKDLLAVAPNGKKIAFVSQAPNRATICGVGDAAPATKFVGLGARWLVNIPHANRWLLILGDDEGMTNELLLMNWDTDNVVASHTFPKIGSVRVAPHGDLAAVTSDDGQLRLLDTLDGKLVDFRLPESNRVTMASFTHDSQRLLTTGRDEHFRLWDLMGRGVTMRPIRFPKKAIGSLVANDQAIFVLRYDGTCQLLDTMHSQPLYPGSVLTVSRESQIFDKLELELSPDTQKVAVTGLESIYVFDLGRLMPRSEVKGDALRKLCELVSAHRMEQGRPIPLNVDAWKSLWPPSKSETRSKSEPRSSPASDARRSTADRNRPRTTDPPTARPKRNERLNR